MILLISELMLFQKHDKKAKCSAELNVLCPPGNSDRQHSEWEEGIPEGRRGRQGQVGVPQLRQRVDTERDGAAAGGEHGKRERRVLYSCESAGRNNHKHQ